MDKPPLGLVPKFIRDEQRLAEIDAAIERYEAASYPIPPEWQAERAALLRPLRVEIDEKLGEPTTCRVFYGNALVFDGVDRSVLLRR